MVESYPILTLLPPLLAIGMVISTRKVLLSLGVGVLSAALLVANFNVVEWLRGVWEAFAVIFWEDGAVNTWYVYILIFTLMLGVITAFVMMSGGTRAFAEWAINRIKTRRGAQGLPAVLGLIIFIDDYFNALAVGQISKPVTDAHRVSRAKLAYIVDSTSAPVAVLAPFSSWGAFIIGIMAPLVAASTLTTSDLGAFLGAAATNYYAIAAVVLVWLVFLLKVDFGPMRREERRAIEEGKTFNEDEEIPGQLAEDLPVHHPSAMQALIVPFVVLVVGVVAGIFWTGYQALEAAREEALAAGEEEPAGGLVGILEFTDVSTALVIGGGLGLAVAIAYYLLFTSENPKFAPSTFGRAWVEGIKSMTPAVTILLLAWMLGDLIGQLGTGEFLGDLVESANIAAIWLVPVMFVTACAMAFATGTSWGSFGILLPIAGAIMNSLGEPELLLAAFGAVLAGAVFGDHASPISDTSILSATGSGANVITHVLTQLPYAGAGAVAALIGYVSFALTESSGLGLAITLVSVVALALIARTVWKPLPDPERAEPEEVGSVS